MFKWLEKLISKIINAIKSALAKLADFLGPFMPILIFSVFLLAPMWAVLLASGPAWLLTGLAAIGEWSIGLQLALAIGTSFLLVPDETTELVGNVVDVAADVAGEVIEVAADAVGTIGTAAVDLLTASPFFWLGAAAVAVLLFKSDSSISDGNVAGQVGS